MRDEPYETSGAAREAFYLERVEDHLGAHVRRDAPADDIYNRRSAVERYFGHLKSDAGTGFRRGRFQIRGLAKVALITGLSVAATNIKLRRARPD